MAEQEDKQELMIQLPWTVPQQSLVITQISVDPETQKIPLDIQHSTDTTAIWSFIAAMVASMVIAIWYGIRSFNLTKQSFDALVKQIQSSEMIVINSNKELIKSQQNLMLKTQKIEYIKSVNEKFESSSIHFIHLAEQFSLFMLFLDNETAEITFHKTAPIESYEYQLHKQMKDKVKEIYDAFIKLKFNFRTILTEEDNEKELINILEEVVEKASLLQRELITNRENFKDYLKEYKQKIANAELMLNTILKEVSILKISLD